MPGEWQPGDRVDGTWLDLPSWLTDRGDQLRAERLEPIGGCQCIEGQLHIPPLILVSQALP